MATCVSFNLWWKAARLGHSLQWLRWRFLKKWPALGEILALIAVGSSGRFSREGGRRTRREEMDPKHKELLQQCHQNLVESITDAESLVEELAKSGALSQLERYEVDNNCSSSSEKVDLLLKMLANKERDHFQELCVALEKTQPHLCSALFVNGGGPVDHSSGEAPSAGITGTQWGQASALFERRFFNTSSRQLLYPPRNPSVYNMKCIHDRCKCVPMVQPYILNAYKSELSYISCYIHVCMHAWMHACLDAWIHTHTWLLLDHNTARCAS